MFGMNMSLVHFQHSLIIRISILIGHIYAYKRKVQKEPGIEDFQFLVHFKPAFMNIECIVKLKVNERIFILCTSGCLMSMNTKEPHSFSIIETNFSFGYIHIYFLFKLGGQPKLLFPSV